MDEIKKDNIADESVEPGQENNEPKDQAKPIFGRRRIQFALILVLLCAVLSYIWLLPDPGVPIPGAMISEIQGDVKVQQPGSDELLAAENGMTLQAGGLVFTGSDGRARIDIGDHVFSRLGPNSDFIFQSASLHKKGFYASFKLEVGEIWIILNGGSLDVDTPDGLASVRGSYMNVRVDPLTGTRVTCLEGHCQVITQGGSVRITTGEFAEITDSIYPPTPGCMTNGDVSIWLSVNPESTRTVPTVTSESPLCWGKYSGGVSPTSPNGPTRTPVVELISPTPTVNPTITTYTPTVDPTLTTYTPTVDPTLTTYTPSPTPKPDTPTVDPTLTTYTPTVNPTITTYTPTPTIDLTVGTPTPSATATQTLTPTPSLTPTPTITPSPTNTPGGTLP